METQFIKLNMTPTGINPCFHVSQYDIGRSLGFIVYNGSEVVDLDGYTCTIEATRSDGVAITTSVASDDNVGTFETTATMTNKADKYRCQLVIIDANSKRIASLPFDMEVTKAAMDENSEAIEEDASLYQQYNAAMQAALANEANNRINADNLEKVARQSDVNTLQNNIDAEATARANADITLQNNIDAEATARQTADNTLQGNINSEAATRASADSNLQSQINQIIAPSGEAPSAAEVQNARIGADGVTYDTLGDAIRGQVTVLKSAISTGISDSGNDFVWESGGIDGVGSKISNSARARMASAVECELYKSVSTSDDLEMVVAIYNTSGVFQGYYNGTTLSSSGTWLQSVDLTGVEEYMVLIVCRLKATPSSDITPSVCNTGVTFAGVVAYRFETVEQNAGYLYANSQLNSKTLQSCDYYIDDRLKLLAGSAYTKTWYFKAKAGEYRIVKIKGAGYPYLITLKVARNTVGIANGTTLVEVTKRIVNFEDDGYTILVNCEYDGYYYLYYGNNTIATDANAPLFAESGMLRNPASNVFGRKRIGVAKGGFQIGNGRNNVQGDSPNHLVDRARTELIPVTAGSVIYSPCYQFIATIFTTGGVYSSNSYDNEAARWLNEYTVANDCYVRLMLRHPDDADITDLDLARIANSLEISCYDEQNRIAGFVNNAVIRASDGFSMLAIKNAGKNVNKDNFLVRGKITKSGNKILDKNGNEIVLTGIGTHNLVEYQNLYTPEVLKTLVQYGINCIRLSVYLKDYRYLDSQLHVGHGYVDHPDELKALVDKVIPMATAAGLYIILDWHSYVPSDGSALQYTTEQAAFFTYFSDKYKAYTNILYEIQNEPYNDDAEDLYDSTAACASIIRANNADAILICGHGSDGAIAMNTLFNTTHNLDMFISPHLYTGSSTVEASIESCVNAGVPVFVTEWGNSSASGTSTLNDAEAQEMFDYCHENGISYCVWKMTYQSMDTAVLTYNPIMANYGYGFGGWHDGDLSHNGHLYFDNIWQYHFGS